jgi:hypothetical protein
MANNSLTIHTNRIFALVLKSPIQMGWLRINNSVTNISRLGTFNLKVPKRENFLLAFFALSKPIWVGDLGTKQKNKNF